MEKEKSNFSHDPSIELSLIFIMPAITLELLPMSKEKKSELVQEITNSASKITGLPPESFYVFIRENASDNVGIGGRLLSDLRGTAHKMP